MLDGLETKNTWVNERRTCSKAVFIFVEFAEPRKMPREKQMPKKSAM